ncbi:MAG: hypothetical protein FWC27_07995 [Firmicutes bacterium]|nr:hypothetical protein [Bacillota bacterium]
MRKRILSLLLAAALVFALASPAFAADRTECLPLVVVQGFNSRPLNQGDKQVFFPDKTLDILKILWPGLWGLASGLFLNQVFGCPPDRIYAGLTTSGRRFLDPVQLDIDSNPVNGPALWLEQFPKSMANYAGEDQRSLARGYGQEYAAKYGWDHVYLYTFDWRLDVFDLAKELDDLIQTAKRETGHDRVYLSPISMGAAVATAWLSEYGEKNDFADVENVLYVSPACQGADMLGVLLSGDLTLDVTNLKYQLLTVDFFKNTVPASWIDALFGWLEGLGLAKYVEEYGRYGTDFFRNYAKYWPGMWTLLPQADYLRAKNLAFPGGGTAEEQAYIAKLDRYHALQGSQDAMFERLRDAGKGFAVISLYTRPLYAPITRNRHTLVSDGVIDTYYTGGFPTLADYGQPPLAAQAVNDGHDHLSPDGMVDASTCLHPENTWFVNGITHDDFKAGEWPAKLALWLIEGGAKGTVQSDAAYPQFTKAAAGSALPGEF